MSSLASTAGTPATKKRRRRADRLSNLPHEILVSILSRLGLVEAVRASRLSSKWKELWRGTITTDLIFCKRPLWVPPRCHFTRERRIFGSFDKLSLPFVRYVNQVLELHGGPTLNEFAIRCGIFLDLRVHGAVDFWLQFAFSKRVQRLELILGNTCFKYYLSGVIYFYQFPAIEKLSAFGGHYNLRDLRLQWVNVDLGFQHFLSRCPFLERLSIKYPQRVNHVFVGSSRLKFLEIYSPEEQPNAKLEITSSNLIQLNYYAPNSTLCVKQYPLLSDLQLYGSHVEKFFRSAASFCGLGFDYIFQLKKLTLGIPRKIFQGPILFPLDFPVLNRLVQLELIIQIYRDFCPSWPLIIIKAAPLLHKFTIKFVERAAYFGEKSNMTSNDMLKAPPEAKEFSHDCLKEIVVSSFKGTVAQVEFIEQLLSISKSLEAIVIDIVKYEATPSVKGAYGGDKFWDDDCSKKVQQVARDRSHDLEGRLPVGVKLRVV